MSAWDEAADWFAHVVETGATPFNQVASDTVVGLLGDVRGAHILDVGCGEGHISRRLAAAGATVVGVDPTRGLIERASAKEAAHRLGVEYRVDSAESLTTVEDESFDAIVASLVLRHVEDVATALNRCRAVLRCAGRFVVVIPHPWSDSPGANWVDDGGRMRRAFGAYYQQGHWSEKGAGAEGGATAAIRQIGWHHRTVATWMALLLDARFRVDALLEPTAHDAAGPWRDTPRFLALRGVAE